jgi:CheY-like chemotaxis protein
MLEVDVIDDSDSMLAILRAILHAFGVSEVRAFNDGEAALAHMIGRPPHVVITDLQMRPLDGIALLRAMRHRHLEPLCFAAMIVLSGYGSRAQVRQALQAGANQFLVKPIAPITLFKRLEWLTRDERGLELAGDQYVIAGPFGAEAADPVAVGTANRLPPARPPSAGPPSAGPTADPDRDRRAARGLDTGSAPVP